MCSLIINLRTRQTPREENPVTSCRFDSVACMFCDRWSSPPAAFFATLTMDDISTLRDALRDALHRRGTLDQMRAKMRTDVFFAMEAGSDAQHPTPPENVVINELIREVRHRLSRRQTEHCRKILTLYFFLARAVLAIQQLSTRSCSLHARSWATT